MEGQAMERLNVYQQNLPVEGYDQLGAATGLPVEQLPTNQSTNAIDTSTLPTVENPYSGTMLEHMINRLTGADGEDRYQAWPERMVRDALKAGHDALNSKEPLTSQDLIKPAMDMSALAGTGGL